MAVVGFSQKWPSSVDFSEGPTYFVEKILNCFSNVLELDVSKYIEENEQFSKRIYETCSPKLHTIRKLGKKKRKSGMIMHPSINVRSKNQYQFGPEVKITKVVPLKFEWLDGTNSQRVLNLTIGKKEFSACIMIGGIVVSSNPTLIHLAKNDGFSSVKDFVKYFSESGEYELLNWTDHEYVVTD